MICDRFNAVIDMLWSILAETVDGHRRWRATPQSQRGEIAIGMAYQWSLSAHSATQQSHFGKITDDMASLRKPSARRATPRSRHNLIACAPQPQQEIPHHSASRPSHSSKVESLR